jgi:hypothetical protein
MDAASTITLGGSISLNNAMVTLEDTTFAEGTELTVGGGTSVSLANLDLAIRIRPLVLANLGNVGTVRLENVAVLSPSGVDRSSVALTGTITFANNSFTAPAELFTLEVPFPTQHPDGHSSEPYGIHCDTNYGSQPKPPICQFAIQHTRDPHDYARNCVQACAVDCAISAYAPNVPNVPGHPDVVAAFLCMPVLPESTHCNCIA